MSWSSEAASFVTAFITLICNGPSFYERPGEHPSTTRCQGIFRHCIQYMDVDTNILCFWLFTNTGFAAIIAPLLFKEILALWTSRDIEGQISKMIPIMRPGQLLTPKILQKLHDLFGWKISTFWVWTFVFFLFFAGIVVGAIWTSISRWRMWWRDLHLSLKSMRATLITDVEFLALFLTILSEVKPVSEVKILVSTGRYFENHDFINSWPCMTSK